MILPRLERGEDGGVNCSMVTLLWLLRGGEESTGWLSRLWLALISLLNRSPADRACVVLLEPESDALAVEPVRAGKHRNFVTLAKFVHADGTFCLALSTEHLVVHLLFLKPVNGIVGCRRSSIRRRIGFHQ